MPFAVPVVRLSGPVQAPAAAVTPSGLPSSGPTERRPHRTRVTPALFLLQGCLSLGTERQLLVHAGQMVFSARQHPAPQSAQQSLGPVTVHLPADLAGQGPPGPVAPGPCYVSQLTLFRTGPPLGAHAPAQVCVPSTGRLQVLPRAGPLGPCCCQCLSGKQPQRHRGSCVQVGGRVGPSSHHPSLPVASRLPALCGHVC